MELPGKKSYVTLEWPIRFGVRFRVRVVVRVRVSSFRDYFSVLLSAQHYPILTVRHRNHSV